jgi:hypothetical protein
MTLIVAIIVPTLLLGLGVLVVDVSSWYVSRSQTQNGADAGAMAVALSCAKTTCNTSLASTYATANSGSRLGESAQVTSGFPCGSGGTLTACAPGVAGKICPANPTNGANYVDVHVKTINPVTNVFSSGSGHKIASCAQAAWGTPVINGPILALTIAECSWNTATSTGTKYGPTPPATSTNPALSTYEVALGLHNPTDATDPSCVSGPSVGPLPGGFGWTIPNGNANTPCTTSFISGNWYSSDSGNGSETGAQCQAKGNSPGVIPCAQNPVVPGYTSQNNACPSPATPSPLIVPVYDKVCVQPGGVTQDEVQTVTLTGATGGNFKLTFTNAAGTSQQTGNIAWNATAATVQSALGALSNVGGTANVAVTLSTTSTTRSYRVEFQGSLANTDFPNMTTTGTALTPNGKNGATISVVQTQQGSYSPTACPANFANGKYYHLATLAAFVITGYGGSSFSGQDVKSWLTNKTCKDYLGTNQTGCVMGYFVKATTGGTIGSGPGTGVTVVQLTG